jgi:hypothetical protein
MKSLIITLILGFLAWQGINKYQLSHSPQDASQGISEITDSSWLSAKQFQSSNSIKFNCDGRIHCSQMTSCEEATFFLANCPGVKMDGDSDGIPCEQQWCAI